MCRARQASPESQIPFPKEEKTMRGSWTGLLASLACSALLAGAAGAQQQQRPAITGSITERGTNAPLADANISLSGTLRGTRSDARGQFRIADVAPGTYTVRVTRLGYSASTRSVTVT